MDKKQSVFCNGESLLAIAANGQHTSSHKKVRIRTGSWRITSCTSSNGHKRYRQLYREREVGGPTNSKRNVHGIGSVADDLIKHTKTISLLLQLTRIFIAHIIISMLM